MLSSAREPGAPIAHPLVAGSCARSWNSDTPAATFPPPSPETDELRSPGRAEWARNGSTAVTRVPRPGGLAICSWQLLGASRRLTSGESVRNDPVGQLAKLGVGLLGLFERIRDQRYGPPLAAIDRATERLSNRAR